jgi:hypothetical protein
MAQNFTELAAELKTKISEYVTNGTFNQQSISTLDGVSRSFYSPQEMIDFYNSISSLARAEEATSKVSTYRPVMLSRGSFKR